MVVKSQILAGGRGLGTFKNGFQGGVHIVKADKVEETAGINYNLLQTIDMLSDSCISFGFSPFISDAHCCFIILGGNPGSKLSVQFMTCTCR